MARLDIATYRSMYLREVEKRLMERRDTIPDFSLIRLHDALATELCRADSRTSEIEVPDDRETALREAEKRIVERMSARVF